MCRGRGARFQSSSWLGPAAPERLEECSGGGGRLRRRKRPGRRSEGGHAVGRRNGRCWLHRSSARENSVARSLRARPRGHAPARPLAHPCLQLEGFIFELGALVKLVDAELEDLVYPHKYNEEVTKVLAKSEAPLAHDCRGGAGRRGAAGGGEAEAPCSRIASGWCAFALARGDDSGG